MKGGFSFCGIDIADLGLEYAPDNNQTYVYSPTQQNISEDIFESHAGGYFFGATPQPKDFILRCFYQDQNITKGIMSKANSLFSVGRSGMLIFKRRPWCYYYATVTKVPDATSMLNYQNGFFVITMKAYYPYARGVADDNKHLFYSLTTDPYHSELMQNTGLLDKDTVPDMTFEDENGLSFNGPILLYNPGTVSANVSIVISGSTTDGSGVTISNKTTGQNCRYKAFNTESGQHIYTDGINGKTILNTSGTKEISFLYHDYGFINVAPSYPVKRKIFATANGTTVTTVNRLYNDEFEKEWYEDKYIYLDSEWKKIKKCLDKNHLELYFPCTASETTSIVAMNEIEVMPDAGTTITKLSFIYKPTYT